MPAELKREWERLAKTFDGPTTPVLSIARSYNMEEFDVARLIGFCDASSKAYAAVSDMSQSMVLEVSSLLVLPP